MSEKHNGYTNYETWLIALWIDNRQEQQEYWAAEANKAREHVSDTSEAASYLAEWLKDAHEMHADEVVEQGGWVADLFEAALGRVDWREVAEHLLAD